MKLSILGSSDAFGSGGRLQTCFHVRHAGGSALIDCGATSLIGMHRAGHDPNDVLNIFISHLHGDHFAGLVWWLIHAVHIAKRTRPLTLIGPTGLDARFRTAAEALFPGSTTAQRQFDLQVLELRDRQRLEVGAIAVTPFEVVHPSGAPPYALRFEIDGKVLSFSGDTEWVDNLIPCATGADLFICECTAFSAPARSHLNWRTIEPNLARLGAKRLLLTHMGPDALANAAAISHPSVTKAEDGLVLDL